MRTQIAGTTGAEPWLLLGEMSHPVCNEYSAALSSISRAAARATSEEAKSTLQEAADRLYDYAGVHRAQQMPVGQSTELSSYLRRLCRTLCSSRLLDSGVRLTLIEEPILLGSEQCWLTGLIVFELITNAARHAFRGKGGHIRIEVAAEHDRVLCRVMDDGTASTKCTTGRGTQIIGALAERLGGAVARSFGPRGTTAVLVFPLEADVSGPPRTAAEPSRVAA